MHIDAAHGDPVVACVSQDLGGRVEAHRLAVEERGGEGRGMVPLQPRACVDEVREACGVRLREPVSGESLDLLEDLPREVLRVAARDHARLERRAELRDLVAASLPCGDRATKLIGLSCGESSRHDREGHGLLLEERHAERLSQHRADRLVGVVNGLLSAAAAEVRMHHVALDRAGTNDRYLDDEVVEAARLEPRQHRHLGARLDLKDADSIRLADHVVGRWILCRNRMEEERIALGDLAGLPRSRFRRCR